MDRILAALGFGGRKAEADVSYDPMELDTSPGRAAKAGGADRGTAGPPDREAGVAREPGPAGPDEAAVRRKSGT